MWEAVREALAMAGQALVIYGAALALVRLGDRRFLGKNTAFDVILGIILVSIVSRASNSDAPLLATIGAGLGLVALHRLFAHLAFREPR